MDYKVVVTAEAEEDLNQFIQYLLFAKKNKQAAKNVLDDFEDTIKKLKYVASSLNVCDNPRLQSLGYRRINFQQHRYFMLYRIENDVVYVDDIFHELQDYAIFYICMYFHIEVRAIPLMKLFFAVCAP